MKNITVVIIVLALLFMIAGAALDITNFNTRTAEGYGISNDFFYFWGIFVMCLAIFYERAIY